jgi:hypothetical protein
MLFLYSERPSFTPIQKNWQTTRQQVKVKRGKAVPLHAMEALGGEEV